MKIFSYRFSLPASVGHITRVFMSFTVIALFQGIGFAAPIGLAINPVTVTGSVGGTIVFRGQITNSTGSALNATDMFFNFNGFDPGVISSTQLLGNPDFILPDATASSEKDLFNVAISNTALVGSTYSMDVFLQDINGNLSDVVSLNIDVRSVPEPAILYLIFANCICLLLPGIRCRKNARGLINTNGLFKLC